MSVLAVAACAATLSGCFTFDAQHNRFHWRVIRKDLRELHADLDFILALEQESPLTDSYYR
jgi:hypothetical protein